MRYALIDAKRSESFTPANPPNRRSHKWWTVSGVILTALLLVLS